MQKNRLASLVVFYVLLSATFSFIPVLAQSPSSSDIIQSILDESKSQVEQKITQLEENGIIIPSSASAFYNDGLAEYDAALASLNSGNLDEARDHALEAMSLFEDAIKALFEAEKDFQSEQQAILNEIFELGESISNSESDADELRDLASENNLNVSFTDYDNAIATALGFLAEGNLDGARQQYEIAQNLLADIYDQIHDEAYSNVDQRAQDFVANTITQLNEIIANASELGISQSIIDQLQDIIDDLQNAVSTDDIIYVSDESSDLYDLTTENPEWTDEEAMEDADDAIEDAQEEIDEADEKIMEASDEGIDTILAEQKLDEARDKLTTALTSFESGDFEDAEVLADEAKELAEDAKELAEELTEEAEEEEEYEEDKEDAEEAIAEAQEEIDKADEKIMEASDDGKETALAEEQLMLAITTLTMAIASFDLGNFEEAEELAEEAEDLASEARGKLIGKTLEDLEDEIELEGMVETGSITVDGTDGSFTLVTEDDPVPILTNVDTEFEGFDDLSEIDGLEVEVEGMFTNGNFLATEIELEEYEGEVETQSGTQSVTEEEEEEIKLDGTVTGISGGTITLETDDGPVTILTDGNTEFKGFDDLSEIDGLEVEVEGMFTNGNFLATEIELEEYEGEVETQSGTQSVTEEEEEEIKLDGTVTGISGGTITLETDDGPVTILTDGNTEFKGFDDLSEIDGLEVKVKAVETNDGLLATEIDLEGEVETQSGDGEDDNSDSGSSD